jgi:hypothetical protein
LPEPTGQLANWPGVLSVREQRDVAYQLRSLERKQSRLCIVRNAKTYSRWKQSSYAKGPLGKAVAPFRRPVAHVEEYTVFRYGRGPGVAHRRAAAPPSAREKNRAGS